MTRRRRRSADLHSIFERAVHEQRRALVGWSAGLCALALFMVALYPTIRDNPNLATLHETYPKALRSLFAIADLTTGTGYLRAELFSVVVPMLVVVVGVVWGGDAIAGEEERGTIDLLLANPVSRRRVLLEKWGALVTAVGIVSAALAVGLAVGMPAVGLHASWAKVGAAVVATGLLGALFATLALALSAVTGRRGLARGVSAAVAVAAYLVSSLSGVVGWLEPVKTLSPWYHAFGVDPLVAGFEPLHLLVLVVLTALVGALAVVGFDRRDLAV